MRITLLGHPEIASLLAMNLLVEASPQHRFTVLMSSGEFASGKPVPEILARLEAIEADYGRRFLEGEFGVTPAESVSVAPDAEPLDRPNSDEGLKRLAATEPDLVVSIRYHRILRPDAIRIPRLGVINLHSGLLPDYRGVMATFWSMLNGESRYGTTIHRIVDDGIDTGPALLRQDRGLDLSRSYLSNIVSLYPEACRAMAILIEALEDGEAGEHPQQSGGAYFSVPSDTDLQRFESAGLVLSGEGDEEVISVCAKVDVN